MFKKSEKLKKQSKMVHQRQKIHFEPLEPRILLSADLGFTPQEIQETQDLFPDFTPTVIEVDGQYSDAEAVAADAPLPEIIFEDSSVVDEILFKTNSANGETSDSAIEKADEVEAITEEGEEKSVAENNVVSQEDGAGVVDPSAIEISPEAAYLLNEQMTKEIVFVDSSVPDYEALISEIIDNLSDSNYSSLSVESEKSPVSTVNSSSSEDVSETKIDQLISDNLSTTEIAAVETIQPDNSNSRVKVILLNGNLDGIEQITEVLEEYQGLSAVHILSHGAAAQLRVGNSLINKNSLEKKSSQLRSWGNSLEPSGDILLYGCSVAEGDAGIDFINNLSALTDADVAASNDDTGSATLGGDWQLEFSTGVVESQIPFTLQSIDAFSHLLADYNGNDTTALTAADNTSDDDNYLFSDGWGADVVDGAAHGVNGDTLDLSAVSAPLNFDVTSLTNFTVTDDATNTATVSNIENIISGTNASDTLDLSVVADALTYTFNADGSIDISDGVNSLNVENIELIIGGSGDNDFVFSLGANFVGAITGNGNDTLNFLAYDDLLTFSGNSIVSSNLDITHSGINNIDVNMNRVDITASTDVLTQGLSDLVEWAADLQNYAQIGDTLSGLGGNVGVNLGNAIDIAEVFDQLRLEIMEYIDATIEVTAAGIQGVIDGLNQTNIQYADRAVVGEIFSPTITTTDTFVFDIDVTEGDVTTTSAITVAGNPVLATFISNINDQINADENLRNKLQAIEVTQGVGINEKSRIAFQATSPDVDGFALTADAFGQDLLGFSPTTSLADLGKELQDIGHLDVIATDISVELVLDGSGVPELVFNFNYRANRATEFDIDLGKGAEDLGLSFDASATIEAISTLNAGLGLILNLDNIRDFYFNLDSFALDLQTGLRDISTDARIGFLAATATGDAQLNAAINTSALLHDDPADLAMPADVNVITQDFDLDLSVLVDVDSGMDVGLRDGLDSFNLDPLTISLTDGNPFEGRDLDIGYNNFDGLGKFKEFNAASFISQVGTVRDWFGSVTESDIFQSIDIPFVTPALDGIFDLADTVGDTLLYDDGDDGEDDESTLVVDIREALKEANLEDKVRIEGDGSKLTLIAIDSSISNIIISGAATTLGFVDGGIVENENDGASFEDNKRKLVARDDVSSVELSSDVTFKLSLVENGQTKDYNVTVTADVTANNETIGNDHARLLDENNEATFDTTQELANKLFEIIGIDENVEACL